jgi:pilus assembly protein CpaC
MTLNKLYGPRLALQATMHDYRHLWVLLFLAGTAAARTEPPQVREMPKLTLILGEQRLLPVPYLSRYSLSNSKARILALPSLSRRLAPSAQDSLLIKGSELGFSDLWIWKSDGPSEHRTLDIIKPSPERKHPQLDSALEKLIEIEVIYSGAQVTLRGEITSLQESARVAALLSGFPTLIEDQTTVAESLLLAMTEQIQLWFKKAGYSKALRLEKVGSQLWIRGVVQHPNAVPSLKKQLLSIYPLLAFDLESLPDYAPTIYFRVFLLELKKNQLSSLGLFWGASSPQAFQFSLQGIQDLLKIDLALQHLEGQGQAKILSNPELVVRAPGEAELFAGGEIPIKTNSRFSSQVSWKKFGLTLKLKVTHVAGARVRLDILTEVSHLDLQTSDDGIPGIQSNRMTTQVDAQFGTPLLLSGLLQDRIREEAKGLPFLRRIPVLGKLFGSEDYLNERSELVAILYPQMPLPLSPLNRIRHHLPVRTLIDSPQELRHPDETTLKTDQDYPWKVFP